MANKRKKENLTARAFLISSIVMFSLFLLLIVLVKTVDVKAVGPNGSKIGFASFNNFLFENLGKNKFWYNFTKVFGIISILIAVGFVGYGVYEIIKKRNLKNIDSDILAMGIVFASLVFVYLFFEIVKVNFRPVLIDGKLEVSFPSSHTMLCLTIFGVATMFACGRLKNVWVKGTCIVGSSLVAILVSIGRIFAGVHWFTDVLGAILISACLVLLYGYLCIFLKKYLVPAKESSNDSEEIAGDEDDEEDADDEDDENDDSDEDEDDEEEDENYGDDGDEEVDE